MSKKFSKNFNGLVRTCTFMRIFRKIFHKIIMSCLTIGVLQWLRLTTCIEVKTLTKKSNIFTIVTTYRNYCIQRWILQFSFFCLSRRLSNVHFSFWLMNKWYHISKHNEILCNLKNQNWKWKNWPLDASNAICCNNGKNIRFFRHRFDLDPSGQP